MKNKTFKSKAERDREIAAQLFDTVIE